MVKNLLIMAVCGFFLTGCSFIGTPKPQNNKLQIANKVEVKELNKNEKEKRIIYKGGYNLEYKKPRVYWFRPLLTEEGNVLSERTIVVAPTKRKWTRKSNKLVSKKFSDFVKKSKLPKGITNEKN